MAVTPALGSKYHLVHLSVVSSTQISSHTSTTIAKLQNQPPLADKPAVVILTAKSKVASKLVSIVEIAKRELAARGVTCWQYNAISSQMIDFTKDPKKASATKEAAKKPDDDEESSDDAFEVMAEAESNARKIRAIPVLTLYLSNIPVKSLKDAFGEQLGQAC